MSVTKQDVNIPIKDGDTVLEITLGDIVLFFKKSRWTIVMAALIGTALGAMYAFSKPNVYTAQVTVLPESQTKGAGGLNGLGSLAGLAGVNLDNLSGQQDLMRPELYPNIIGSIPFALNLLNQKISPQTANDQTTLQEFIERATSDSFVNRFQKLFTEKPPKTPVIAERHASGSSGQVLQITSEQDGLIKYVQNSVETTYEKKTGIVTITATEYDPVVAATVARLSLEYLTNYIVAYRTEKARMQVTFLKNQVGDAEEHYKSTEYALSAYRDRNRNLFLNTAKIDEQRLQANYVLAQSVYTDLSKQLEQAKIKVQEETPVFKILEPPTVPLQKSGPKRTIIMIGFAVSGALLSIFALLIRHIQRLNLVSKL